MRIILLAAVSIMLLAGAAVSQDSASSDTEAAKAPGIFDSIYCDAPTSGGAKIITYAQFMDLRDSGEKFVLVDVLSRDDFATGHIPGAISLPCATITKESAEQKIPKGSNVIVYCLGSACHLSIDASCKLAGYGYKVLDYKGGLDEWQEKGNKTVL